MASYRLIESSGALRVSGSSARKWVPADTEKGFPLWILPISAGAPSRLADLEAFTAAATPDGEILALSQLGFRLLLVGRDGAVIREWPPLRSWAYHLGWSPDGKRLRFTAVGPDQRHPWIREVSRDGGEPGPLWPGRAGRWTPDGRYYVFARTDEKGRERHSAPHLGHQPLDGSCPGRLAARRARPQRARPLRPRLGGAVAALR